MSWAICTTCGRELRWRATAGARLADVRCPHCRGPLKAKRSVEARSRAFGARLVYTRRNGTRRIRYYTTLERARRDADEARPYYERVELEVPGTTPAGRRIWFDPDRESALQVIESVGSPRPPSDDGTRGES